ncbi:Uncharacterized protein FWK35_00020246 [Aphis craccivora]|uniref:Mutator-like transposase domain-containing protein n=1 Tax=Aphis craccivora TaxID=307492 RepID=A0A6G0YAK4_APHCR|nr:Uncharacterized protein FWK35_00020246 [Aphis craccivora]
MMEDLVKRRGCYSEFWLKCRMCNIKTKICSVKDSPKTNCTMEIGYTQFDEFLSRLEIFPMISKTYSNIETTLDTEIKNTAWFDMQKAG